MVSAKSKEEDVVQALRCGADDYLVKVQPVEMGFSHEGLAYHIVSNTLLVDAFKVSPPSSCCTLAFQAGRDCGADQGPVEGERHSLWP